MRLWPGNATGGGHVARCDTGSAEVHHFGKQPSRLPFVPSSFAVVHA